eukprot:GFKZ01001140.1.p2 GENE.GFKZ01001140.1~~GFKZ01001140.1.p2  ORF type:complete len:167 (+),score=36.12 GFKZ01001140.1:327-827(+)
MNTDLQVLSDRLDRLEAFLGPLPSPNVCLLSDLSSLQSRLRSVIPDEAAAASQAVGMLSTTCASLRELSSTRRQRALRAGKIVDATGAGLVEMEGLMEGLNMEGFSPPRAEKKRVQELEGRVAEIEKNVEEEEMKVDELLEEFDRATKKLNGRIAALAEAVRNGNM